MSNVIPVIFGQTVSRIKLKIATVPKFRKQIEEWQRITQRLEIFPWPPVGRV
jgi:hypothetical protein